MKSDLAIKLKEEMGYTEEIRTCETCRFHEEVEGFIDRSWDDICTFNNIGSILVKKSSNCTKWEKQDA